MKIIQSKMLNKINQKIFTVFFVLFIACTINAQTARVQVIHNSAHVAVASVDIYWWDTAHDTIVVRLDDFDFRVATPIVDVHADIDLSVIIAGPTSTDPTDQVITDIPIGALTDMEKYVVFASSVLDPTEYGAADAIIVDVIARVFATSVDNAAHTDIIKYIPLPAASNILYVAPGDDQETIVASFTADLNGLAGGVILFASVLLDPTVNQNGEAFGIYAALTNGTVVAFPSIITDISKDIFDRVPENYSLSQNYPNPFNPATTISFTIPKSQNVSLKIYNILGSEVATIINHDLAAGLYSYDFDASNLASGTYIYQLTAGNFTQVRKMNLLK